MTQQMIAAILLLVVLLVALRRRPQGECAPPREEQRPRQPRGDALSSSNNLVLVDDNANILTVPVKSMFLEDFKNMTPDQVSILGKWYLGGYGKGDKDWSGNNNSYLRLGAIYDGKWSYGDFMARNLSITESGYFSKNLTVGENLTCDGMFTSKGKMAGYDGLYIKGNTDTTTLTVTTAKAKTVQCTESGTFPNIMVGNIDMSGSLKVGNIPITELLLKELLIKNGFLDKWPGVTT